MVKRNIYIDPTDYQNGDIRQKFMDPDYTVYNTGGMDTSKIQYTPNDIIVGGAGAVGGVGANVNTNGALRLWGADRKGTADAVSGYKDYQGLAEDAVMPDYNYRVSLIDNGLSDRVTSLTGQKAGINQNYDSQVENQNLGNTLAKNGYSNQLTSRGLARSSIAATGLAGMDNSNNRIINNINSYRTAALNGVDAAITDANKAAADSKTALGMDKQNQISDWIYREQTSDADKAALKAQQDEAQREWQATFDAGQAQQTADNQWRQKVFDNDNSRKQKDYDLAVKKADTSGSSKDSTDISKYTPTSATTNKKIADINSLINSNLPISTKIQNLTNAYNQIYGTDKDSLYVKYVITEAINMLKPIQSEQQKGVDASHIYGISTTHRTGGDQSYYGEDMPLR